MSHIPQNRQVEAALYMAELQCQKGCSKLTDDRRYVLKHLWRYKMAMSPINLLRVINKGKRQISSGVINKALSFFYERKLVHRVFSRGGYIGCEHPRQHGRSLFATE